jgi:hypothetical protein
MPRFSTFFRLGKSQAELDFVDVSLDTDNPVFLDPFALSQKSDRWSLDTHNTVVTYFQSLVDAIRAHDDERARGLLSNLSEPNETRLGYSKRRPQGAGIGALQSEALLEALRGSAAVRTGFINSLQESELMIEGVSFDKISDLTTNIIRGPLANYTLEQCRLHAIATQEVALAPCFNTDTMTWEAQYLNLPVHRDSPVLLVPKSIVRRSPAVNHQHYYGKFVLNFLKNEELGSPMSRLVRTLKNHKRVVYKKDLRAKYPLTKAFLYDFSRQNPHVLAEYLHSLIDEEKNKAPSDVEDSNETAIARALAQSLNAIRAGNAQASEYHKLMIGIVEFIFYPNLLHPKLEHEIHEGRKRIDILVENGARNGIFYNVHNLRNLPCAYIPFECKNYTTEVANPELDQLAGRFSTNRGKMGFLCCRQFENRVLFVRRCQDTFRDDRGLIVPIDDATVSRMLGLIEAGSRAQIDDMLSELVSEVWAT